MAAATPRHRLRAAAPLAAGLACAACASGPARPGAAVALRSDLGSAVAAAAAAAPGCGLKLVDGRRAEDGKTALLVFLEGGLSPQPESAVVTVHFETVPAGVSAAVEARPLAEHGMAPPDIRAGSAGLACVPCAAARAELPTVRYSPGLAAGNAARAEGCLRAALGAAAPER